MILFQVLFTCVFTRGHTPIKTFFTQIHCFNHERSKLSDFVFQTTNRRKNKILQIRQDSVCKLSLGKVCVKGGVGIELQNMTSIVKGFYFSPKRFFLFKVTALISNQISVTQLSFKTKKWELASITFHHTNICECKKSIYLFNLKLCFSTSRLSNLEIISEIENCVPLSLTPGQNLC